MNTTQFDWQRIRQRVDEVFSAIDHETQRPASEVKRILKARARALAKTPAASAATETVEILEFQLANANYAVETRYIREACPLNNLTALPSTPNFVMGVVNIRGEILSVIDIRKFFGLPEQGISHLNKVIVLEHGNMIFGILADHLEGVRQLPSADVQSARQAPEGIDGGYVAGITTAGLAILNAKALLTDEKIVVQ